MRLIRAALLPALLLATLAACTGGNRTFGERVRDTVDPPSGPVESTTVDEPFTDAAEEQARQD